MEKSTASRTGLTVTFICSCMISLAASFSAHAQGTLEDEEIADELAIEEKGFYELESTIDMKVDVASLFEEDELVVGSSVSSVTRETWNKLGARRFCEALNDEVGFIHMPGTFGGEIPFFRGYATRKVAGVATLIDGVPMNNYDFGNATYMIPTWELGTLDRIEIIKGPGSAIYGSDAFHGVVALKTFESDKNTYQFEASGAYPWYGDGAARISAGNDKIRMDFSGAGSYQGNQKLKYHYIDYFGFDPSTVPGEEDLVSPTAGTGRYKNIQESTTGVLKLRIMPTDKLTLKLGGYFYYGFMDDNYGIVYLDAGTKDDLFVSARNRDKLDNLRYLYMGTAGIEYKFPHQISLEATGYYWYNYARYNSDATPFEPYTYRQKSYRGGARVLIKQPDNSIRLQWLIAYEASFAGIPYTRMKVDLFTMGSDALLENGRYSGHELIDRSKRVINSGFAQFKWNAVKDILYFIAGGRLDYYSDYGLQATPRAGIIIKPVEPFSIKMLYGRAFRAPSASEQKGKFFLYYGNKDLKAETIDVCEFILMYKLHKSLKLNATGFYTFWQNGINYFRIDALKPYFQSIYLNQGRNRSYGAELSLYASHKRVGGNLGFGWARSEALNTINPVSQAATSLTGTFLMYRSDVRYKSYPEYSIIGGIYYTIPVIEVTAFLNNRIYLNWWETTPNFDTQIAPKKLPVYYRLDLNLSRMIADKLELIVDIRNLLNRTNYVSSVWGQEDGYVEPGISAMLRVNYKI
ncbi:MAG: TonB-dependent receptor [Spirochaetes bacterium]|nr:TonB-dependent receptor [Spirochaetota bacterium]